MKTEISLPDKLFEEGEQVAARLGVSRSELYATALEAYLQAYRDAHITAQLDQLYAEEDSAVEEGTIQLQAVSIPMHRSTESLNAAAAAVQTVGDPFNHYLIADELGAILECGRGIRVMRLRCGWSRVCRCKMQRSAGLVFSLRQSGFVFVRYSDILMGLLNFANS